jgi:hypothetical protein
MGMIHIRTTGSFPCHDTVFSAVEHGHAHAVAEAIQWLAEEVLPAAIDQDHRLHHEGSIPSGGFERGNP